MRDDDAAMSTRRRLAATALPLLMLAAATRGAVAKSAEPGACRPGLPAKACAQAKTRFVADGGDDRGCPHCAAAAKPDQAGDIPARGKLF